MNNQRLSYIDFLKGIGIILVVWAHIPSLPLNKEIYAFHMPLFAFLAGIFAVKKPTLKETIVKKGKSLLVPFFFFSIAWWGVTLLILKDTPELSSAFNYIFYILGGSGQNSVKSLSNVTVWFLAYLFTTHIIHFFNSKLSKPKIGAVAIGGIGVLSSYTGIPLPYSFDTALTLYPFFFVGSTYLTSQRETPKLHTPIYAFVFLVGCYLNTRVDTASNNLGNPILFYIVAFSAIALLLTFAKNINSVPAIDYIGKNSIDVLIFHMIFLKVTSYFQIIEFDFINLIGSIALSLITGKIIRTYLPQAYGRF